jgi:putative FmdB family regulatory protein
MPRYEYKCTTPDCEYTTEQIITIDDRDKLTETPCPDCGGIIERIFGSPVINLGFRGSTVQSKAPTQFKEHLQKIKKNAGSKATGIEL